VTWTIPFYTDANGRSPVQEFIDSLSEKQQAKLLRSITLLRDLGTTLREPDAKPLGDGLWELRPQFGGEGFRIVYFLWTGRRFVLLHAFKKKTSEDTYPRDRNGQATARRLVGAQQGHPVNFDDYLNQKLEDPTFRKEWEADEPAFQVVRALVAARAHKGWTQAQLARRMGTDQASISRAESTGLVTAEFLARFAAAVGGSVQLKMKVPGYRQVSLDVGALAQKRAVSRACQSTGNSMSRSGRSISRSTASQASKHKTQAAGAEANQTKNKPARARARSIVS
jgi:phage-related protein/transcriptional regulator with XRE-family HTH domain